MAHPIFILGLQRSGTTWIGNLIAAHPEVAAVTAERHGGIHESLFFSHFAQAWDWTDPHGRAAALRAFLDSDYCQLMEFDADEKGKILTSLTAAEAFGTAMDQFAARQGASAWVEKSPHHTRHARDIAQAFPEAHFVAIYRSTPSLIRSRLGAYGRKPPKGVRRVFAILRAVGSNAFHLAEVRALARKHPNRVVHVDFEALRAEKDQQIRAILSGLNLSPVSGLKSEHAANATPQELRGVSLIDTELARLGDRLAQYIPGPVLRWLRARLVRDTVRFPGWVWAKGSNSPTEIKLAPRRRKERSA